MHLRFLHKYKNLPHDYKFPIVICLLTKKSNNNQTFSLTIYLEVKKNSIGFEKHALHYSLIPHVPHELLSTTRHSQDGLDNPQHYRA